MMKHISLFAIVLLIATACGKSFSEQPSLPTKGDYFGTVEVSYEGTVYENPGISVSYTPSATGETVSLTLHQIKFVPQMPVSIDVTIPTVDVSYQNGLIILSCNDVVPQAMGGDMPKYTVSHFLGTVDGENLSFSLYFGDYPTSFTGKR